MSNDPLEPFKNVKVPGGSPFSYEQMVKDGAELERKYKEKQEMAMWSLLGIVAVGVVLILFGRRLARGARAAARGARESALDGAAAAVRAGRKARSATGQIVSEIKKRADE